MVIWGLVLLASVGEPLEIPVYPGGQRTLELRLTERDFLPWVRAFFVSLAEVAKAKGMKVSPEEVEEAVSKLKEVKAEGFAYPREYARTLLEFYGQKFPSKEGWRTIVWLLLPDNSFALLVKVRGEMEELFAFGAKGEKLITHALVVRTEGLPDVGVLLRLLPLVLLASKEGASLPLPPKGPVPLPVPKP